MNSKHFEELFPDNRLTGDTHLRQAQLVMLRLLKAFHFICESHNLRYWIDAGTLLGAVRHGGFIPWDDDIDVIMPKEDYEQFLNIAEKELPYDMFFQSGKTDPGFICPWVEVRDRYSYLEETTGPYPYSQAISMDIFPAVYISENQHKWRNFFTLLEPWNNRPEPLLPQLKLLSNLKRLVIGTIQYAFILFMKIPAAKKAFMKKMNKGEFAWEYEPPIRWLNRFPNDIVFPLKKIRFEDFEFWGPADPHVYLRDYFGDYMTPPPPEKQVSGHSIGAIYPVGPNLHFSALNWEERKTEELSARCIYHEQE